MQVSWIDAERIKALVAQISPPEPELSVENVFPQAATRLLEGAGFVPEEESAPLAPLHSQALVSLPEPGESCQSFAQAMRRDDEKPEAVMMKVAEEEEQKLPMQRDEPDEEALHNPAAALPLSRIRDKLRAIRQRAAEAGILARRGETVSARSLESEVAFESDREAFADQPIPELSVPHGSKEDRLAAFAAWAHLVLRENGGHVLVMNDDGEILWGGEAKAGLVLSTMMAWGAAMKSSPFPAEGMPPVMRRELSSGHVLTIVPCGVSQGLVHVTVVAPQALSGEQAEALRGGLHAALG